MRERGMNQPILLDITRNVRRKWSGASPSGIDRVCDAYAGHFADRAYAVLQLRGRWLVLDRAQSARIFAALMDEQAGFRRELARVLFLRIMTGSGPNLANGSKARPIYLNVSHSGFDRTAHWRTIRKLGVETAYLIHDLIPILHPEFTTAHKVARHRKRVEQALRHASGIIANSQATANDLRDFAASSDLPVPPTLVAPLAGAQFHRGDAFSPQQHPLFVAIGTVEARKNYDMLLRAWSMLIDRMGESAPHLVIAGNWGVHAGKVRAALRTDPRLTRFVAFRSGLDDAQIGHLVAGARAVLFPSRAEGFGLPLVEALHNATPVIASDLPVFRQLGQSIPTFLSPDDAEGWAGTIAQFCTDGPDRKRQVAMLSAYDPPRWTDHFERLEAWLELMHAHPASVPASHAQSSGEAPRFAGIPPCAADVNAIYTQLRDPVEREQELQC